MKILNTLIAATFLIMSSTGIAQTAEQKSIMEDAQNAKKAMLERDSGIQKFIDNSSGYAIFPNIGEGAFIIGAASGNGVLYENGQAQGMADLKKIDVGLQAGGQAVAQILFFETEEALAKFKYDKMVLSAEVSAVMLKKGASKNANYTDGVVVFAMPKAGAMADLSVGGQRYSYTDFDDM